MSDEGGAESRLDATQCKVSWGALMNVGNKKTARDPGQHDESDDATRGGIVEQRPGGSSTYLARARRAHDHGTELAHVEDTKILYVVRFVLRTRAKIGFDSSRVKATR